LCICWKNKIKKHCLKTTPRHKVITQKKGFPDA